MPSPYLTYALAALSFGLAVAFFRISDENADLSRAKIAVEMKLETAEAEAKVLREKYSGETRARQFAEAAQTIAETSERAMRSQLLHETKTREAAEKSLEEAENARHAAEAALAGAEEQVRLLTTKLAEAGLAKASSDAGKPNETGDANAAAKATSPDVPDAKTAPSADASERGIQVAAQASMAGAPKSWFWSLFGW